MGALDGLHNPEALRNLAVRQLENAVANMYDGGHPGEVADYASLSMALFAYADRVAKGTMTPAPFRIVSVTRVEEDRYVVLLTCGHWLQTRRPDDEAWFCDGCGDAERPAAALLDRPAVLDYFHPYGAPIDQAEALRRLGFKVDNCKGAATPSPMVDEICLRRILQEIGVMGTDDMTIPRQVEALWQAYKYLDNEAPVPHE